MKPGTVAAYMTKATITFLPSDEVTRAVSTLLRQKISGAPVMDENGTLVGILTAKDCFRAVLHASYHQEPGGNVAEYMTSPVSTMDADTNIVAAAERFLKVPHRRFPVMREGRLVGIITRLDLLRAFETER